MLKNRLISLRKSKNKTQQELADLLGISRPAYTAYERGNRNPDYETLSKLADYYGVTTDYLLGRSDNHYNEVNENKDFDSIQEINRLLDKYEIDDMSFFDIEKWKSMSPEQIRELESYFQYLVQKSKELEEQDK
ncbi:helix-turn-helix domain-containing protein [Halobacillus naozhouensis]|uniref:Helix-turn-helix transcriptional regulator n=1 Tax=Halobacillus naozhouensis TaxID=554880 RepID=A0ABY8J454_9BACI|nr:helix-turn-helix transcriptional regulator [Halobacillus naozhouensis]WFT76208.1 helix-turn-helix transcriptional regulator [Halobacillus naozhouensis]